MRASARPLFPVDRLLRPFAEVRSGEGAVALALAANLFVLLLSYYVLKTVREPLILTTGAFGLEGARLRTAATGVQALLLMGAVPAYAWLSTRMPAKRLVRVMAWFFIACLVLFAVAAVYDVPALGFCFFVWVGIFNVAVIAQFWSFANDLYARSDGERLFPIVAFGAPAGAVAGAWLGGALFEADVGIATMLEVAAVLLVAHVALHAWVDRRTADAAPADRALSPKGGFRQLLSQPYLRAIAIVLLLLNLVKSTGEYLFSEEVLRAAGEALAAQGGVIDEHARRQWIGAFYGDFFQLVNVATVLVQALVVSRLVSMGGILALLVAMPIVSFGTYGALGAGAGFAIFQWMKAAENATDYSVMNTARATLWLPTSREAKYQAKQAADTVVIRFGDLLAVAVVGGTALLGLGIETIAAINVGIVVVWLALSAWLAREYRRDAIAREPRALETRSPEGSLPHEVHEVGEVR